MQEIDKAGPSPLEQDRQELHDAIHEHQSSKENLRREKDGLPFTPFKAPVSDEERRDKKKKDVSFLLNYLGALNSNEKLYYEKRTGKPLKKTIQELKTLLKRFTTGEDDDNKKGS